MAALQNLDAVINKLGYGIVEEIKKISDEKIRSGLLRHIEKSLGVLVNDGVYAYYVFSKSKSKDKDNNSTYYYSNIFIKTPVETLSCFMNLNFNTDDNNQDDSYEVFFQNLSQDLHKLLFFKDLLEQALIYARYHAKALGDNYE
jgi:CRISPR/Cas system CMR-associated protein Cmr5 small subunit